MKTASLARLLIVMIAIVQLSCKKTDSTPPAKIVKDPPVVLSDIQQCHNLTVWDSAATSNKLIGSWEWQYIQCFWNPEDGNDEDFKGLTVQFKTDNTVEVKENGGVTQISTWKVVNLHDGYFEVDVTPIVLQLPGRIVFCDDWVVFTDSYTDGCDNYFKSED